MTRNRGPIAIAGFNYQHAYAGWRVVELLQKGQLLSVTFEGSEDLDLRYRDRNKVVTEYIQVKTREEGQDRWSISEFARTVLGPMIRKGLHQEDVTYAHFVTTGEADSKIILLKDQVLPTLRSKKLELGLEGSRLVAEVYNTVSAYLRKRGSSPISEEQLIGLLRKLKISTRQPEMDTLRQLTLTVLFQLGVGSDKASGCCKDLFTEVSIRSGRRHTAQRTLTAEEVAAILDVPFISSGYELDSIHNFKDPAEAWYVHRHEESDLTTYLENVSRGLTQNFLITGESGIGKSSFLNFAQSAANALGIFSVKMKVFDTSFDNFLLQLVDEILEQLEPVGIQDVPRRREHPRNRLIATLKAFRRVNKSTPILLMVDQFERLFEESKIRIDEARMREVWRKFTDIAHEINELGHISFTIAARQHFFWIMFPSDTALRESKFHYTTLRRFHPGEAEALLNMLLEISDEAMTPDARDLFLDKTDHEPQVITLSYINAFSDRISDDPMDFAELLELEPWNEVFKRDIEIVCRDRLQQLVIFAMANIGRELCDVDEILERVALVKSHSQQQIKDALFQIQNTYRLVKQPKAGKFSFYHRKVGEYIHEKHKTEFPEEWVEEGVIWDVHKMIVEEVRIHSKLGTFIGIDHLKIINDHRDRLELEDDELILVIKSSIIRGYNVDYWVKRAPHICTGLTDFFTELLHHEDAGVQVRGMRLLSEFGDERSLEAVELLIDVKLEGDNLSSLKAELETKHKLIEEILSVMQRIGHRPTEPKRLRQWIFVAILYSQEIGFWVDADPAQTKHALRPIIRDLAKGDTSLIAPSNLTNVIYSVSVADPLEATEALLGFFAKKKAGGGGYHTDRARTVRAFLEAFSEAVASTLPYWLKKLSIFSRAGDKERSSQLLDVLLYGFEDFSSAQQSEVIAAVDETRKTVTGSISAGQNASLLRKAAEIFKRGKASELHKATLLQLGQQLQRSSEMTDLIEAVEIYCDLNDVGPVTSLLDLINNSLKSETTLSHGERIIKAQSKLIARHPDPVILRGAWHTAMYIAQSTSGRDDFPVPIHRELVSYIEVLLRHMVPSTTADSAEYWASLEGLDCNQFLKCELLGVVLLHRARLGEEVPESALQTIVDGYERFENRIQDELMLGDEELKGDVLVRYGRLCRHLTLEKADRILERAWKAYRYAMLYFQEREDLVEKSWRCATRLIMARHDLDPSISIQALTKDVSDWDLDIVADALREAGRHQLFLRVAQAYLRGGAEDKHWVAEAWFERAAKTRDAKLLNLSWDGIRHSDAFWRDPEKFISRVLPIIIEKDDDPTLADFRGQLLSSEDALLLKLLANSLLKAGHYQLFLQTAEACFKATYDYEAKYYAAEEWFERAIETRDGKLLALCWDELRSSDTFWDDPRKLLSKVLPFLIEEQNDPALADFRQQLLSSDDVWLLKSLADALLEAGHRSLFLQIAEACLKAENDDELKFYAAERWFEQAMKMRDAKLLTLCWKQLWPIYARSYDPDELLSKVLPIIIEEHADPALADFRQQLLSSDDVWLLESLADVLLEGGHRQLFLQTAKACFEAEDDDELKYHAAEKWLKQAIERRDAELVTLFRDQLRDSDAFRDDPELLSKVLPIITEKDGNPDVA